MRIERNPDDWGEYPNPFDGAGSRWEVFLHLSMESHPYWFGGGDTLEHAVEVAVMKMATTEALGSETARTA